MGSADANQPNRDVNGSIIQIHDVKLSPPIAQKVHEGPLPPTTAEFPWLKLSQH